MMKLKHHHQLRGHRYRAERRRRRRGSWGYWTQHEIDEQRRRAKECAARLKDKFV